jgi:hypothetical protein
VSGSKHRQSVQRRLGHELSSRLLADFKKHGIEAIDRLRRDHLPDYFRTVTKLIPQEVQVDITHSFTDLLQQAAARAKTEKIVNNQQVIEYDDNTNPAISLHELDKSLIDKELHSIDNASQGLKKT